MFGHDDFGDCQFGGNTVINEYEPKYIIPTTTFSDKLSVQNTQYIEKYPVPDRIPEDNDSLERF